MRASSAALAVLLALLELPRGLHGQVSTRVTVARPAPGALGAVLPTTVATAPLPGLVELNIPAGAELYVRDSEKAFVISPGSAFRREVRNGQPVLVETRYEVLKQTRAGVTFPDLRAASELIHPGDAKLIDTGPWVGGWASISMYYVYLFRPVETPPVISKPRTVTASFAELSGRTSSLAGRSVTPRVVASPSQLLPSTASCAVPTTLSEGGLGNLVCLLLKDGQAMTLPSGLKLFRRQLETEVWSGDKLIYQSSGLVVRDGAGRHWLLESKGYYH